MSMKTLLVLVALGAAIAAPNFAQAASYSSARAANQGWSSRVHVYAPNHSAPWYDSYGNANMNPDRQLGSNEE
jgi:hypothetical protein